jgi:hypothetical protein
MYEMVRMYIRPQRGRMADTLVHDLSISHTDNSKGVTYQVHQLRHPQSTSNTPSPSSIN